MVGVGFKVANLPPYAPIAVLVWSSDMMNKIFGFSELSGESLLQHNILCCETNEKTDKMVKLGGAPFLAGAASTVINECVLLIPLPWSTIRASRAKLAYDSSLLSTNILVQITFNDPNHFMGHATAATTAYPNEFIRADAILKQSVLSNKADSMRMTLMNNPNLMVSYPFVHRQSGTRSFFNPSALGEPVELNLQSFIEADLLGVGFMVVPTASERSLPVSSTANKFASLRCRDIQLIYNGAIIYSMPFHLSELATLTLDVGNPDYNYSHTSATGTNTAKAGHVYYLPLTPSKSIIFESEYFNTSRYASQTMTCRFTVEAGEGYTGTEQLSFRPIYYYNAMCSTSKGVSTITYA